MSRTLVTKKLAPKNGSCITEKEKSKVSVQKESEKNIASELEVSSKKECLEEGLNETQNAELVIQLATMEISTSENSFVDLKQNAQDDKMVTGQAVDSNNASNSGYPVANQKKNSLLDVLKIINVKASETYNAVQKLSGKFEDFYKLENKGIKDSKGHFDAMNAKVLEETKNTPNANIKSILPASGHVDNSVENIPKADLSDNKTEEYGVLTNLGPNDVVLILDSTLFETGQGYPKETTDGDNAGLTHTIDEMKDQQNKANKSVDFKAKHLKPVIEVEGNIFRISFDVSFFDIENITCVVGDKLDVGARVSRISDYGSETHEIHQVFEVPPLADREKFTACIRNGFLYLEAPMKHAT